METNNQFDAAKIKLEDGRVAFDCVKLAQIETEGAVLSGDKRNIPHNCNITVRTLNSDYHLEVRGSEIRIRSERRDEHPNRFPEFVPVNIHGSTWGGSMIKLNYIGVGMHMEFSYAGHGTVTTTEIESLTIKEIQS